jgi:hypothetical protein
MDIRIRSSTNVIEFEVKKRLLERDDGAEVRALLRGILGSCRLIHEANNDPRNLFQESSS